MKTNTYYGFTTMRPFLWAIPGSILFITFISLLFRHLDLSVADTLRIALSPTCEPAGESHTVTFYDYVEFQSIDSASDAAWDNILPPNGGYIYRQEGRGQKQGYGISMFHQLHCLQMVRTKLQTMTSHMAAGGESGQREQHAHQHHVDDDHVFHCLDYIRQVFLPARL